MRLAEVEVGDLFVHRLLIRMISRLVGYRLPDAARVAFYDQKIVGPMLGERTQKTMRVERVRRAQTGRLPGERDTISKEVSPMHTLSTMGAPSSSLF
jgi:hypothetical protein